MRPTLGPDPEPPAGQMGQEPGKGTGGRRWRFRLEGNALTPTGLSQTPAYAYRAEPDTRRESRAPSKALLDHSWISKSEL